MKSKSYINDDTQTNLKFQQLSRIEKLKEYREILYKDMCNKLFGLEVQRRQVIETYKNNIKDIDLQINSQNIDGVKPK